MALGVYGEHPDKSSTCILEKWIIQQKNRRYFEALISESSVHTRYLLRWMAAMVFVYVDAGNVVWLGRAISSRIGLVGGGETIREISAKGIQVEVVSPSVA